MTDTDPYAQLREELAMQLQEQRGSLAEVEELLLTEPSSELEQVMVKFRTDRWVQKLRKEQDVTFQQSVLRCSKIFAA